MLPRGRVPALFLAGLLLASACAYAGTTVLNEVTNESPGHAQWMKAFDAPANALADFDGDGIAEIVSHNDNQRVYVLATTTSRVLAEFRPDYPSGWTVRPINDPAAADVDGDGRPEIVIVTSAGHVCVYKFVSGTSTSSMSFSKQWCKRMDAYGTTAADAGAWVEDVNGDGRKEIFSQTEQKGIFAFNWDGSVRWSKPDYGGNAGPLVTDLENDGKKEMISFGDGGEVRVYDASSGSTRWTFYASKYVWPASIPVSGNAADLDNDGKKEIVFIARDAHESTYPYANDHFMLFVLTSSGAVKWRAQPSWGHPLSYTHPILADLNGDGKKDVLAMDWNTIGHKPGNWEALGPAHVFAYRHDGVLLWKTDVSNTWSNDDLGLADVDGDGVQEILALGRDSAGRDGVWYLDSRTGAKETHVPVGDWTALRGPVLGDFDGSGKLSWGLSVHRTEKGGAWKMFRTDAACNGAFLGWQNRHGCGDDATPPPPPPPPPPGNFTASFSTKGGNEWWLAVKVQADRPLAGVDVRIDGGAWKPLSFRSWGEWAASYHAPEGSVVQFQARATDGSVALSGCHRWTTGAPTECGGTNPPPPPPPGDFAAQFKNVRGNEWWVETDVSVTGGTLAGVDARVNGGSWIALTKQSWGSWAKSVHAPPGSKVEFRARSTDGQSVISSSYAWPPE